MKIVFATIYDLRDIKRGSGTFHSLAKELERQGHVVHYLGPFEKIGLPVLTRACKRLSVVGGKRYSSWQDPFIGRRLGRAVLKKLAVLDFDVLLTNDYAIAAYTRSTRPTVIYTDGVFPFNYAESTNPRDANLSWIAVRFSQRIARLGLRKAGLCVFPAIWVVKEALRYHEIPVERICLVPFGANLEPPPIQVVQARDFRSRVQNKKIRLLFVGKDWERKGGDVAVETVAELRLKGFDATLDVVGWRPPTMVDYPGVTFHGVLDKSSVLGRSAIHALFTECDALILPSRGEGFVISALEAAAYGLPVLGYRAQGVVDAVKDRQTGILLTIGARGQDFAKEIQVWIANPEVYQSLSRRARDYFDTTVNWERAASSLICQIDHYLNTGRAITAPGCR
jgi:glycosyltransferase involved in cell wall biosynthesis